MVANVKHSFPLISVKKKYMISNSIVPMEWVRLNDVKSEVHARNLKRVNRNNNKMTLKTITRVSNTVRSFHYSEVNLQIVIQGVCHWEDRYSNRRNPSKYI